MSEAANSLGAKAQPFIEKIEEVDREIESLTGQHMAACKRKRQEKKEIYQTAKDAGLQTRPLKGIVKQRKLQRKIDQIPLDFDIEESAVYKELAETLGPLGAAAAARAGYGNGDDDVRPGFMQRAEREKQEAHERGLKTVGRGPDPVDAALS